LYNLTDVEPAMMLSPLLLLLLLLTLLVTTLSVAYYAGAARHTAALTNRQTRCTAAATRH